MVQTSTRAYRKIYACYSHHDAELVHQFARFGAAMGDQFLLDTATLRAGTAWGEELRQLIREADVFQLFWSRAAAESTFVEHEWRFALSLVQSGIKSLFFVRPVYWEEPLPAIPDELLHLHFQRIPAPPST